MNELLVMTMMMIAVTDGDFYGHRGDGDEWRSI